ncbi:MAG: hypothetical protein LYZ66_06645 [Nitrososphaerales archaeon]|nr:hypothetical protein [Nitrososphaerales archaeon]
MDPPNLRKVPSILGGLCEACESLHLDFCVRYQVPVEENNVCDDYVSVLVNGKRMWMK